jgi:RHS repeat-associated protein
VISISPAPTASAPTAITATSFTANWSASTGAASYRIDVSNDVNFGSFVTGYNNLTVAGTTLNITPLPMNVNYYYRVRAVNASGASANSTVITLDLDHNYIRNTTVLKSGYTTTAAVDAAPATDKIVTHEFFDGLGRPTQTVVKGGSPSGLDVVQAMVYDQFGRDPLKYLPYADGTSGWYKENALKDPTTGVYTSGKQYQFYQTGGLLASDTKPFAETRFEPSPLNRVLEQGAPGLAWQPDATDTWASTDKTMKKNYQVVTSATEVRLWTYTYPTNSPELLGLVNAGTTASPIFYPVNKLYRNRTKNEDGNEVIEYMDDQGRILLKRVQAVASPSAFDDTQYASTYYIYDDFSNLVCVLPPEASKRLTTEYFHGAATNVTKEAFLKKWAFRYKYDERRRMIRKQLPGAGQIIMVYDDLDRLALTQDSVQRAKTPTKEWTFTKYDAFSRPVMTGKYLSNNTYTQMKSAVQTYYNGLPVGQVWGETYYGSGAGTVVLGYDNKGFPQSTNEADYYTVMYYDKYDTYMAPTGFTYTTQSLVDPETSTAQATTTVINAVRPIGQVTGMLVKNLAAGTWLRTVTYYDQKYRPVQVISDHQKGKITASSILDFVGKVLYTRRSYVVNSVTTYVSENPHYDQFGRLLWTKHATNGPTEVMVAKNEYNEVGQPVDRKLHSTDGGATFKQSVDYRYNIRGWLYKINEADVASVAAGDATADYFGMEMAYQNSLSGITSVGQFGGNITAIQWSKGDGGTARRQGYSFGYDNMSRLKDANHFDYERTAGVWNWNSNSNGYGENLTYDHNGNILTLLRKGFKGSSMDNLTYAYNGNQLSYVNDAANATLGFVNGNTGTDDYSYDVNGNLNKDKNKGITTAGDIKYNFLNLPEEIKKGANEKVKYLYDAAGRKLAQEVYNSSGALVKTTDYIGVMVYENNTLKLIQHPEGRVLPDGANWEYQYFIKDHLGNVRITFTAKPQTATNYTTDFEAATNPNFQNYTNSTFDLVDHTDAAGTVYQKVQWLNGGANGRVGLAKSLAVMPGDQVSITAYAKYMNLGATANPNAFITSLAAAFGVSSGSTGEALKIYNGLNSYAATVPAGDHYQDNEGAPKAFVTIIFFDKDYNLIDAAWDQVTTTGAQTSPSVKQPPHDVMSITAKAPEAGYAFVFVSNEHFNYVDVYFDDATVTHTPSQIVSNSDYFPFGLSYNSMERTGSLEQKYLYNGKELQDEMALNWYDYGARMYMPEIGRWGVTDPLAEKARRWTPYRYAFNNPLRFIDPDGMFEYSNGYTTQDSRTETGSVQHSGSFDNSKEANKINAAIDARAAAITGLRQNAAATMDAAIRQREGGSQVQQGKNDALQQAPLTQEIVDKVFSKSFKEDMVTGGNSAINRNKVGPRTGLDAATRDGIIQTLRGSAEQVLFEEGGNRFLGVIEIMIFQMDPAIISPSNPKGEVPGTLESIYFSPTFTPGKPIFENPGRPANRPFGIINQDDTQWRVLYKFQETALN